MIRSVLTATVAFLAGAAAIAVPPLVYEPLGALVAQRLYDCGVRIADDVTEGTLDGFVIRGHRYGICLGSNVKNLSLSNVTMFAPEFSTSSELNAEWERKTGTTSTPGYKP